jgi:CheY-like chemotaxis protein
MGLTTDQPKLTHNEDTRHCASVLVVDDSSVTLALQEIVLGSAGYKTYTAESGEKAIQVLSEIEEPDLILLDMQLGDMSGIDFLNKIEEEKPEIIRHVPIVFVTGMDKVPDSKAIGFIRKPADTDQFLKAVSHFIEIGHQSPYTHQ